MARRAVFPGTFDPLTIGHLAIADTAHEELDVERVDLVISLDPIGKQARTPVEARLAAVEGHRRDRPWLAARATDQRLVADIAAGYDVLVVGADKWHQLHDVAFYESPAARDDALRRLPPVAVAPRAGIDLPRHGVHVLGVPERFQEVSSTAVRRGRAEWGA